MMASPSPCRVLLFRHAEARNPDPEGRVFNYVTVPLSAHGEEMARNLGRLARYLPISTVYSSDILRARLTAEALADGRIPLVIEPGLREVDIGRFEGMSISRLHLEDPRFLPWQLIAFQGRFAGSRCQLPADLRFPGGESVSDMSRRVVPVFRRIAAANQGQLIAVVTHAWALEAILCHITGVPISSYYRFGYAHASLTAAEVGPDGRGRLLALNADVALSKAANGRLLSSAGAIDAEEIVDRQLTCRLLFLPCSPGSVGDQNLRRRFHLLERIEIDAVLAAPTPECTEAARGMWPTREPTLEPELGHGRSLDNVIAAARAYQGGCLGLVGHPQALAGLVAKCLDGGSGVARRLGVHPNSLSLLEVEADGRGMLHVLNGGLKRRPMAATAAVLRSPETARP